MKHMILTDEEFAIIKGALEVHNDMTNDMALDNIELPQVGSCFTVEDQHKLIDSISEVVNTRVRLRSLLDKFGIKTNDQGYST